MGWWFCADRWPLRHKWLPQEKETMCGARCNALLSMVLRFVLRFGAGMECEVDWSLRLFSGGAGQFDKFANTSSVLYIVCIHNSVCCATGYRSREWGRDCSGSFYNNYCVCEERAGWVRARKGLCTHGEEGWRGGAFLHQSFYVRMYMVCRGLANRGGRRSISHPLATNISHFCLSYSYYVHKVCERGAFGDVSTGDGRAINCIYLF